MANMSKHQRRFWQLTQNKKKIKTLKKHTNIFLAFFGCKPSIYKIKKTFYEN
ncbi:hypothetical protein HanIR_Chr13g0658001 [Helianthus annuus]|nr:hypothetical protein HanIR_Chr13g0658001 [Helianthus annuus]